ncbi:unnamed protein product [Schistocephalus solidus]|uniref:Integrin_alpha2 domain-containing protein n=1 Tax=Schistocephalus solidus TaxID=70667 RepID=A0A183SD27_SCHSO|nr:unnamed protein product [Schistocephalus solidus]
MKEYFAINLISDVAQRVKQSLKIIVPQKFMSGEIVLQQDISDKPSKTCPSDAGKICFTYSDMIKDKVTFKSFSNISQLASKNTMNTNVPLEETVPVLVLAPDFMNPTPSQLKLTLIASDQLLSPNGILQDHILLSDSVDDMRPAKVLEKAKTVNWNFSANGKVGVTVAVGFVCTGLCLLVIMAYFLLQRWRRSLRQDGVTTYNQMAFTEQATGIRAQRSRTKFHLLRKIKSSVDELPERITEADEIILQPINASTPISLASSGISPEQVKNTLFYFVSMPANRSTCSLVTSTSDIPKKAVASLTREVYGYTRDDAEIVTLPRRTCHSPIWNRQSVAGVSKLMFIDFTQMEETENAPTCLRSDSSGEPALNTFGNCEQCQNRTDLAQKIEIGVRQGCNI